MKQNGFKISQYACAVLLIVSSIALVAYQVIEIEDVASGIKAKNNCLFFVPKHI